MTPSRSLGWRTRAYHGGHVWLERLHAQSWIDYRCSEVLRNVERPHRFSGWDADSLWLGEVHLDDMVWLRGLAPRQAADYPERWRLGYRCFAAKLSGTGLPRCASVVWVACGPRRFQGRWNWSWQIPANAVWIFDAWAHPLIPGTYPDLLRAATEQLRREGFGTRFGYVEYGNGISLRAHRALGGEPLGWVASLHLGPINIHLDHPRGHWRLRWGARPVALTQFAPAPAAAPTDPAATPQLSTG